MFYLFLYATIRYNGTIRGKNMEILKDTKTLIQDVWRDINHYKRDYIGLWLFVQFVLLVLGLPLILWFVQQSLQLSGIQGLTHQNIGVLLTSPIGLLFLFASFSSTVFVIMVEVTLYLFIQEQHAKGIPFELKKWLKSFNSFKTKMIGFQTLVIFFYFVLFIPILGQNILSSVTRDLYLPYFISGELLKSTTGTILYFNLVIIGIYINLRLVFTIYFIYIDPTLSIMSAMKKSIQKTKGKMIKMLCVGLLSMIALMIVLTLIQLILLLVVYVADTFFISIAPYIATLMLTLFGMILFFVWGISKVWLAKFLFYFASHPTTQSKSKQKLSTSLKIAIITLFVMMMTSNLVLMTQSIYGINTQLVAHRGGDLTHAVENTIQSLINVEPYHPDYVEMDVMETKDGQFIVFHDKTLRRMTGDPRGIHELTLEEVTQIPMMQNGMVDYIPSFESFLIQAQKQNQKLLIEFKSHGYESKEVMDRFVALINKYDQNNEHRIQSFDKEQLKTIQMINPNIQVGFVIPIKIGRLEPISVDFITLEEFSFNQNIQQDAFNQGVEIFLWTINDPVLIRRYLFTGVDAMITSNISVARGIYDELNEQATLTNRLRWLLTDWLK